MHSLLTGCTALERLQLQGMHGLRSLHIVSPNLRAIGISAMCRTDCLLEFQGLVVQDAPCLEILVIFGSVFERSIRVVSAPKLTLLAYLPLDSRILRVGLVPVQVEFSHPSSCNLHFCYFSWYILHCPPENDPYHLDTDYERNDGHGYKCWRIQSGRGCCITLSVAPQRQGEAMPRGEIRCW